MPTQMQNILGRLGDAAYQGWRTAVYTYRQEYFVAEEDTTWDSYAARMARYYYNRRYRDNTIYSQVNRFATFFKQTEQLYKFIRGLRNPIARLVAQEKAKVWGGFVNFETFKDGALVINGADDTLLEAIRTTWQATNIVPFKNLLVQEGGTMGDVAIKVVDDMERGRVYLEVLDPRKVKDIVFDNRGNVKEAYICYERFDEELKKWWEYGEFVGKEEFIFYRNGEVYDRYPNPYGFAPIEWIKHVDNGKLFGETSWHNTRSKIDNLNDLTTLLHNNIRRVVETKYAVTGDATIPRDANGDPISIQASTDSRDSSPLLQMKGGDIKPIVFPLDIDGTLNAIAAQSGEVEDDLPILTLETIRENAGKLSGVAIENLYSPALDAVEALQGIYYAGLISATQMAISIGGMRRYEDYRAYNLSSYENGDLDFVIRPKKVFQDTLSLKDNLTLTLQAVDSNASRLALLKLGYTDDDIDELEALQAAKTRAITRQQMREQSMNLRANAASQRLSDTSTNQARASNSQALEIDNENPPAL